MATPRHKGSSNTATRQPVGEVMFPNGEMAATLTQVRGGAGPVLELQVTDKWLRAEEALSLARQLVELVEKDVIR
jgi:hypothetical protein